jgi:hypothetical protein
MYGKRYAGDPRWITARFDSQGACGHAIKRGDRIFFYPNGKKALCQNCGEPAHAEFVAAAQDEAMMTGQ